MTHAIAVYRYDISLGGRDEPHVHDDHQLVWSPDSMLTCDIGARSWILSPHMALFVPAGIVHATSARQLTSMAGIHLAPEHCPLAFGEPTVVSITPLLHDLLLFLESGETGGPLAADTRAHTQALVYDLLKPVSVATVHVPIPHDDRAREVAAALVADPGDPRTLAQWADVVGSSVRTLARVFTTQTGLPFAQWRTRVRLRASLGLLADGVPVKVVARSVGYDSSSAFIAAFRRHMGQSPASYFGRLASRR